MHSTAVARLRVSKQSLPGSLRLLCSYHVGVTRQPPLHSPRYTSRSFSSQPNISDSSATFQPGNRLSGRKCLITGGTSGIGYAIAERFLQEGASTIVLVGRSHKRLEEAASRLAPFTNKSSVLGEPNDKIATRAPEEHSQQPMQGNIRLLVGDVSDAGSWMRELEKEMASLFNSFPSPWPLTK